MQLITASKAIEILKNQKINIAFLDVRERKQYVQGFAFGSINCPLPHLKKKNHRPRSKPKYAYCFYWR